MGKLVLKSVDGKLVELSEGATQQAFKHSKTMKSLQDVYELGFTSDSKDGGYPPIEVGGSYIPPNQSEEITYGFEEEVKALAAFFEWKDKYKEYTIDPIPEFKIHPDPSSEEGQVFIRNVLMMAAYMAC